MMTNAELEAMMTEIFNELIVLRRNKAGEYSEENDALANFRRNAVDMGMPMEVVWRVYAGKHWDAISQYVRDVAGGTQRLLSEPIENRVADLMVYLVLLRVMIQERRDESGRRPAKIVSLPPA